MKEEEKLTEAQIHEHMTSLSEDAPDVYLIWKDTDGNYRGFTYKNGKLCQVRTIGPETALQELLTHA